MRTVDAVIPAYNDAGTLERCVASVLESAAVTRIIIVEDCSADNTWSVAQAIEEKHPNRVATLRNPSNSGSLEARRKGLALSCSDYVMFVDADDILEAGCIDDACAAADKCEADIVAFAIKPEYLPGAVPDLNLTRAREHQYAVEDAVYYNEDIVHAIYRDDKIPWSVVGKLFRRKVVEDALRRIPELRVFQSEDALMMLAIALGSKKMVASTEIPPYRYVMGIGGTVVDQMVDANSFASVCKNRIIGDEIDSLLRSEDGGSCYEVDRLHVRKALLYDPCNRFPLTVIEEDRSRAFSVLIQSWGVEESISGLADMHAYHPEHIVLAVGECSFSKKRTPARSIGLVYHSLGIGGVEDKIRQTCQVLSDELGRKVVLLIDEDAECLDVPNGVEVCRLPSCFDSVGDFSRRAQALERAINHFELDCLIHNQWLGLAAPWDALLAKCLGLQVHMHVHGVFFSAIGYDLPELYYLPMTYRLYDSIICLSDIDARYWGCFNEKVRVTVNGLRESFRHMPSREKCYGHAPRIAWCGRIDADKGVDDALRAMQALLETEPNAMLTMAGPVSDSIGGERGFWRLAETYGVQGSVELTGPLDSAAIVELYAKSDVFLLSSRMEGWSISLCEAKAAGLPCVMYDLPSLRLCSPNTGVLTAELGDAVGLGRQLARIISDNKLSQRLSALAREDAEQYLDYPFNDFWHKVIDGIDSEQDGVVDVGSASGELEAESVWKPFADMLAAKSRAWINSEAKIQALDKENIQLKQELDRIRGKVSLLKTPSGFLRICTEQIWKFKK